MGCDVGGQCLGKATGQFGHALFLALDQGGGEAVQQMGGVTQGGGDGFEQDLFDAAPDAIGHVAFGQPGCRGVECIERLDHLMIIVEKGLDQLGDTSLLAKNGHPLTDDLAQVDKILAQ